MMNLCFSLYENKFKKKPLPSLSSRKGLTNWRFLLKNNKALCASYFNFQSSIALITMRLLMRNCANKRKKYQPAILTLKFWILNFSSKKLKLLVSPSLLGFLSPGNVGTEGGVKTIEGWERLFVLISFARLRTGASALYFLVYEWIFLKENNDIDVGLGKHAF